MRGQAPRTAKVVPLSKAVRKQTEGDGGFGAVMSAADAWNCRCSASCSTVEAAHCLYTRTLEELSEGRETVLSNLMIGPLAIVVSGVRSVQGQGLCQEYIRALQSGEQVAALDACQRLIELAETSQRRGWDDVPGHV